MPKTEWVYDFVRQCYVERPAGPPPARAWNHGLRIEEADFIMNADAQSYADTLEKMRRSEVFAGRPYKAQQKRAGVLWAAAQVLAAEKAREARRLARAEARAAAARPATPPAAAGVEPAGFPTCIECDKPVDRPHSFCSVACGAQHHA